MPFDTENPKMKFLQSMSLFQKNRRNIFNADDIFSTVKCLNYLLIGCGLRPLNQNGQMSLPCLMYTTTVLSYLLVRTLTRKLPLLCTSIECYTKTVQSLIIILNALVVVLTVFIQTKNSKKTVDILRKIKSVDERLSKRGMAISYSTKYIIKTVSIASIPLTINEFYAIYSWDGDLTDLLNYMRSKGLNAIPVTYLCLVSRCIVVILSVLKSHFQHIEERLLSITGTVYYEGKTAEITEILKIYDELCGVCDTVENTYSSQIILLVVPVFMNITGGVYSLINNVKDLGKINLACSVYRIVRSALLAVMWIIFLIDIVGESYGCMKKVSKQK